VALILASTRWRVDSSTSGWLLSTLDTVAGDSFKCAAMARTLGMAGIDAHKNR
jgi:hypothetical protein